MPDWKKTNFDELRDRSPRDVPMSWKFARDCGPGALRELVPEQVGERLVGALGLLQADHVGPALAQPGQQPRDPLLDRVDVPGREAHRAPP